MKKKRKQQVEISSAMMVDVLFILLIFFILVSTIKKDKAQIKVKPPKVKKTQSKQQQKNKRVIIVIDRNSKVFVDNITIKSNNHLDKVLKDIRKRVSDPAKLAVILRVDGESKSGKTTEVLALLSENQLIENLQWEADAR